MGRYNLLFANYLVLSLSLSLSLLFFLVVTGASEGIGRGYALEVGVNSDKFIL